MRPADFTKEQIIEAGLSLQGEGRNITGFALRNKVGGGNPNRLKQVWEEHAASQQVAEAEPVAELPVEVAQQLAQLTESLVSRLNTMAVEINDRAVKASERRVSEVVRTAGEQREQAERELEDASRAVDELEQQLDEARESNKGLSEQLAAVQGERQSLAVELAQVKERLVAVERAAKVAADGAVAADKALRAELDTARRAEQAAREREAQAMGSLSAMEKTHQEDAEVCVRLRGELRAALDSLALEGATAKNRGDQIEQLKAELAQVREIAKRVGEAEHREQLAVEKLAVWKEAASAKPAKAVKPAAKAAAKGGPGKAGADT